ncbi:NAD(P)H-dependent FMN reductase [Streptomyces spiroverticillatus]|uniref:NAD(P)H-dependent FMN reductase n=1 Tax=Streptomyces finlayi TaxID=67296 RepID=A0A918X021_9ACTN|nr:NADPH-dependent FMN reductase [Streptomyces finlayi]GHA17156.1 NAD(P)H-dependent FMN reductase [Streptomyces spiroverticillatus]GHC99160.1 NAD(P)H-dependent FMN reductase [Streptomyces finlayi]
MSDLRFLALSGSLRRGSHNTALLHALKALAPDGVSVEIHEGLGELPYFNQDREEVPPASVADLRARVREADGLIIATPEYNSAIPGVLMNALDWLSRPAGDSSLRGRPTAILGASPSQFGTARGQLVLRQILHRVQAPVVAHPEVTVFRSHQRFDTEGTFLADQFTESLLKELLAELVHLAELTHARSDRVPA